MTGGATYFLGWEFTLSVFFWVQRSVTYVFFRICTYSSEFLHLNKSVFRYLILLFWGVRKFFTQGMYFGVCNKKLREILPPSCILQELPLVSDFSLSCFVFQFLSDWLSYNEVYRINNVTRGDIKKFIKINQGSHKLSKIMFAELGGLPYNKGGVPF